MSPMDEKPRKRMVSLTLEEGLIERLKAWIAGQEMPPRQNVVMAKALEEFLDKQEARRAKG